MKHFLFSFHCNDTNTNDEFILPFEVDESRSKELSSDSFTKAESTSSTMSERERVR